MPLFGSFKKRDLPESLPPLPPLQQIRLNDNQLPELRSSSLDDMSSYDEHMELPPLPEKEDLHNIVAPADSSSLFPEIPENEPPSELPPFPDEMVMPRARKLEDREVATEKRELKELKKRIIDRPIFVSVDRFREVLGDLDSSIVELHNLDQVLSSVEDVKNEQDKLFDSWQSKLKDLERKFMFVDKTIFETTYV